MNSLLELIKNEEVKTIAVIADSYSHFMSHVHAFLEHHFKGAFVCTRGNAEFLVNEKRIVWCTSRAQILGMDNWELFHIGFKHNIAESEYNEIKYRLKIDRHFRGAKSNGSSDL